MQIAQVAPLYESVPPTLYGGTERIVSYLTEELVERGHDVTLFASGDSVTSARLVSPCRRALRLDTTVSNAIPHHIIMLEQLRQQASRFDVIHFHIDLLQMLMTRTLPGRTVTTLHGRLDLSDLQPFYRFFSETPLVSISNHQRRPIADANWVGTVYHGLPDKFLSFNGRGDGGYLAFLGRIAPEKRPDRAIEIAVRSGWPLKIAAKIDRVDLQYWEQEIRPLIERHPQVEYIGEIGERQRAEFLGDAAGLLFPIDWPEPFGLVMIEAMACGTPVVAFRAGSVPEIVEHGVNGYIVDSMEEAIAAVGRIGNLSRMRTRQVFERRFTVERMASDYEKVYAGLSGRRSSSRRAVLTTSGSVITDAA